MNVEYVIAVSSGGGLVLVIAFVAVALVVMRCRNKHRESKRRQQQQQNGGSRGKGGGGGSIVVEVGKHQQHQRMLRSKSGGEVSVADSVSTQVRRGKYCFEYFFCKSLDLRKSMIYVYVFVGAATFPLIKL